jgi:MoxR-like ATPase
VAVSSISSSSNSFRDEFEGADLVVHVEAGGRLVEQEHGGVLGERAGEHDALALPAADRADGAVGESGDVRALPEGTPFFPYEPVLEVSGPLPEAQLDRFLFEMRIDYPSLEHEERIVSQHSFTPLEKVTPVMRRDEILHFREAVAQVPAAPNVVNYAVRLVRASRPDNGDIPEDIRKWIRWGASPRASQYLIIAGRARAACQGRFNVACEDLAALAPLILRHRIIRSFQADAEGQTTETIIRRMLEEVEKR